eukprot:1024-Heterococcus_DN1.PRE.1
MLIFISPRCYCVILVRAIQFPNCLPFTGEREFSANVWRALSMTPQPLTPEQRYSLSWTAATQRLIDSSQCALRSVISDHVKYHCMFISGCTDLLSAGSQHSSVIHSSHISHYSTLTTTKRAIYFGESKARRRRLDELAWLFHKALGEGKRGDTVRRYLQAGVISDQNTCNDIDAFAELVDIEAETQAIQKGEAFHGSTAAAMSELVHAVDEGQPSDSSSSSSSAESEL